MATIIPLLLPFPISPIMSVKSQGPIMESDTAEKGSVCHPLATQSLRLVLQNYASAIFTFRADSR